MFSSSGQRFPKTYQMTCGVEFVSKQVPIPDTDISVELHIFDTGGQDLFTEMLPGFWKVRLRTCARARACPRRAAGCRGPHHPCAAHWLIVRGLRRSLLRQGGSAIVLVYDVARPYTFEACRAWFQRIQEVLAPQQRLPGVLVANKMDLNERAVVMRQDGQQMAQELGLQARPANRLPSPPGSGTRGCLAAAHVRFPLLRSTPKPRPRRATAWTSPLSSSPPPSTAQPIQSFRLSSIGNYDLVGPRC